MQQGSFGGRVPVLPAATPVANCMPVLFTEPTVSLFFSHFPFSLRLARDQAKPGAMFPRSCW